MTKAENQWSFSNAGPEARLVWLEPWAEEFKVPAGSTVLLRAPDGCELGEVEQTAEHFTVWATADTVSVFIDGKLQDSASASIPLPPGLTKEVLHALFEGQPSARLGGAEAGSKSRASLWQQIKLRFSR